MIASAFSSSERHRTFRPAVDVCTACERVALRGSAPHARATPPPLPPPPSVQPALATASNAELAAAASFPPAGRRRPSLTSTPSRIPMLDPLPPAVTVHSLAAGAPTRPIAASALAGIFATSAHTTPCADVLLPPYASDCLAAAELLGNGRGNLHVSWLHSGHDSEAEDGREALSVHHLPNWTELTRAPAPRHPHLPCQYPPCEAGPLVGLGDDTGPVVMSLLQARPAPSPSAERPASDRLPFTHPAWVREFCYGAGAVAAPDGLGTCAMRVLVADDSHLGSVVLAQRLCEPVSLNRSAGAGGGAR